MEITELFPVYIYLPNYLSGMDSSSKPQILIVEDDRDYQHLLSFAHDRNRISCDFSFAITSEQALKHIHKNRPQVILIDYDLPDRDGIDLLKDIRSSPELRYIPVLMFSIHDKPSLVKQAYDQGVNAFIAKPNDYKSLVNLWNNICSFWMTIATLPSV